MGEQNPDSVLGCFTTTGGQRNRIYFTVSPPCVLACVSVHASSACVFKQDSNIGCSLIILPSALFKASINSLMPGRHAVETEGKDEAVGWKHITFYG